MLPSRLACLYTRFETPQIGVTVRESNFLAHTKLPANVTARIARDVVLPKKGMAAREIRKALAPYKDHAVIEFADPIDAFCGFEDPVVDRKFNDASRRLLDYKRSPFCYEDAEAARPPYSQCCRPRKPGDPFFPCIDGFDDPEPLVQCTGR